MSHHFEANTYLALGVIVLHVSSVKKKKNSYGGYFEFAGILSISEEYFTPDSQPPPARHRWSSFTLRKTTATTN